MDCKFLIACLMALTARVAAQEGRITISTGLGTSIGVVQIPGTATNAGAVTSVMVLSPIVATSTQVTTTLTSTFTLITNLFSTTFTSYWLDTKYGLTTSAFTTTSTGLGASLVRTNYLATVTSVYPVTSTVGADSTPTVTVAPPGPPVVTITTTQGGAPMTYVVRTLSCLAAHVACPIGSIHRDALCRMKYYSGKLIYTDCVASHCCALGPAPVPTVIVPTPPVTVVVPTVIVPTPPVTVVVPTVIVPTVVVPTVDGTVTVTATKGGSKVYSCKPKVKCATYKKKDGKILRCKTTKGTSMPCSQKYCCSSTKKAGKTY